MSFPPISRRLWSIGFGLSFSRSSGQLLLVADHATLRGLVVHGTEHLAVAVASARVVPGLDPFEDGRGGFSRVSHGAVQQLALERAEEGLRHRVLASPSDPWSRTGPRRGGVGRRPARCRARRGRNARWSGREEAVGASGPSRARPRRAQRVGGRRSTSPRPAASRHRDRRQVALPLWVGCSVMSVTHRRSGRWDRRPAGRGRRRAPAPGSRGAPARRRR